MLETKDYSKMALEELVAEEKKMNSLKIPVALLIGFMIGVAFWSATHKWGFFVTIILMAFGLLIGKRHSQTIKNIQAELSRRNSEN